MRDATFLLILIALSILVTITFSLAYGNYIPYANEVGIKSDKPIICIYEPKNPRINFDGLNVLQATKYGIWEWQYKLELFTGERDGWDFDIKYYENWEHEGKQAYEFDCDIHFIYGLTFVTDDRDKRRAAQIFVYNEPYPYSLIEIYTHRLKDIEVNDFGLITNMTIQQRDVNTLRIIVAHEMGHAFGLGHMVLECNQMVCLRMKNVYVDYEAEQSIMYGGVSIDHQNRTGIQEVDLRAVVSKYSDDGWGGYNRMGLTMYWWPE